jgi:enoyl-CoA hydratase
MSSAQQLAAEIAAFPQACLRADRASALAQWDRTLADALRVEGAAGFGVLASEGLAGAQRFTDGAGRHGEGASRRRD